MCNENIHNYKPRGVGGWCRLTANYLPCLFAIVLIALNVLPYHLNFLPRLVQACDKGEASWVYYYYCVGMMVLAEVMVYGNYFFAISTPPEYVPHDPWAQAPIHNGRTFSENHCEVFDLDRHGKLRFCGRCNQFKPDHAHHCQYCGRCIYRMDHHCPWINNCVGRGNAKYFLLFIGYIPVGAFHIVLTTLFSTIFQFPNFYGSGFNSDHVFANLMMVMSMIFSTAMGFAFFAFAMHFFCMVKNGQTSVSRFISSKKTPEEVALIKSRNVMERLHYMYDVFGSDQKWYKMMFSFRPNHHPRSAPPGYTDRFGGDSSPAFISEVV